MTRAGISQAMSRSSVHWAGISGVGLFVAAGVLGGRPFTEHSHVSQYISETYATGTPHRKLLRILGYIPSGLTYLTVPFALSALGIAARNWPGGKNVAAAGLICGLIAVVGATLFLGNPASPVAGLIQRLTESAVLGWIVICVCYLKHLQPAKDSRP